MCIKPYFVEHLFCLQYIRTIVLCQGFSNIFSRYGVNFFYMPGATKNNLVVFYGANLSAVSIRMILPDIDKLGKIRT